MNWEQRFCPDLSCIDEAWMVRRDDATCDLWWVAAHENDPTFIIAAAAPVCPHCGTTLLTPSELEGGRERHIDTEVGPVFDYVRSLS